MTHETVTESLHFLVRVLESKYIYLFSRKGPGTRSKLVDMTRGQPLDLWWIYLSVSI